MRFQKCETALTACDRYGIAGTGFDFQFGIEARGFEM